MHLACSHEWARVVISRVWYGLETYAGWGQCGSVVGVQACVCLKADLDSPVFIPYTNCGRDFDLSSGMFCAHWVYVIGCRPLLAC